MRGRWGGLTNSRPIPRDAPCTMDTPPPEAAAENALAATASLAIAPLLTGGFGLDPSFFLLLRPPFHGFTSIFDANYAMRQDWIEKVGAVQLDGWTGK